MANPNPCPEHRWKKGQSGNPGGMPKGCNITGHLRRLAQQKIDAKIGGKRVKMTRAEAVARSLFDMALDRSSKHCLDARRMLYDRLEGKALERVAQSIDISAGAIVPRALVKQPKTDEGDKT